MLSQSVFNYQDMISETDARGLYFFLKSVVDNYTSNYDDETGIQLMTVHTAKGLEFPVTIVTSLQKDSFPGISKDPTRKKWTSNKKDTFYTPFEYLEYKKPLLKKYKEEFNDESLKWMEIEDILNAEEEERVVYVAMTRAADLLIVSSIGEIPEQINNIKDDFKVYNCPNDLDEVIIEKHYTNQEEEMLKINFSKYNLYNSCPFNYNLAYNIGFAVPRKDFTDLGAVFHKVMDSVNQKLKNKQNIGSDELEKEIERVYSSFFDIKSDKDQFDKIKNNILRYAKNKAVEYDVIDSELSFSVEKDDYILNGVVDLIYKISDSEIGILDYKNAEANEYKIQSYSKQLYTYASVLKELPEFKDKEIVEAKIHFVKSGVESIPINESLIKEQENKLDEVVQKIKNDEYPKLTELHPDRENRFCDFCEYRDICKKGE